MKIAMNEKCFRFVFEDKDEAWSVIKILHSMLEIAKEEDNIPNFDKYENMISEFEKKANETENTETHYSEVDIEDMCYLIDFIIFAGGLGISMGRLEESAEELMEMQRILIETQRRRIYQLERKLSVYEKKV